jgi:hypothetical protein
MRPTTKPGTPSARKACRQSYMRATSPATSSAIHAPIGAPNASTVIAIGRRSGGKQSETMAVDGGVPPASPMPAPIRASANCIQPRERPQSAVKPDQTINEIERILRRFERSANHEIGMPQVT